MEEQILKLIKDHFYSINGTPEKSAKEITSHVMEFIEWLRLNCDTGNGYWDIGDLTDYYDDNIYQYWLINIKNK